MKRGYKYQVLIGLAALGLAAAGLALSFLPDTVPVHWNWAGEMDRMGSKLEYLVFPVFAAVMAAVFGLAAWRCGKKETKESALAERICLWAGYFGVLLFTGLGLFFMWRAARWAPGDALPAAPAAPDMMKAVDILLGLLLIALGNAMPKATRNDFFGLRTQWSLADDEVWRKSQRFGGISAVALGFFILVTAAVLPGETHFTLMAVATLVWAAVCMGASKHYYEHRS